MRRWEEAEARGLAVNPPKASQLCKTIAIGKFWLIYRDSDSWSPPEDGREEGRGGDTKAQRPEKGRAGGMDQTTYSQVLFHI